MKLARTRTQNNPLTHGYEHLIRNNQLIYIQYVGMWTCSRPVVDLYNTWVCPCTGDSKPPRQEKRIFQKRSKALMKYTLNHCGSTLGEVDIPFTVSSGKQKWPQNGDSPYLLISCLMHSLQGIKLPMQGFRRIFLARWVSAPSLVCWTYTSGCWDSTSDGKNRWI